MAERVLRMSYMDAIILGCFGPPDIPDAFTVEDIGERLLSIVEESLDEGEAAIVDEAELHAAIEHLVASGYVRACGSIDNDTLYEPTEDGKVVMLIVMHGDECEPVPERLH